MATADPSSYTVAVSREVVPPLLDQVIMHEVSHAVAMSYDLLDPLRSMVPPHVQIMVEEWAAEMVEDHGIEIAALASESLGRPVCVRGYCHD